MAPPPPLTVFHDGACPLCRAEIAHYRRQRGAEACAWVDADAPDAALGPGLTRAEALARFTVRLPDGTLRQGVDAFIALWSTLPGTRRWARRAQQPAARALLRLLYALFLGLRPLWRRVPTGGHRP